MACFSGSSQGTTAVAVALAATASLVVTAVADAVDDDFRVSAARFGS